MPTNNPRIKIVFEQPLFSEISEFAENEGKSVSSFARDLIREALELREDLALETIADERAKAFDRKKAITFAQAFDELS